MFHKQISLIFKQKKIKNPFKLKPLLSQEVFMQLNPIKQPLTSTSILNQKLSIYNVFFFRIYTQNKFVLETVDNLDYNEKTDNTQIYSNLVYSQIQQLNYCDKSTNINHIYSITILNQIIRPQYTSNVVSYKYKNMYILKSNIHSYYYKFLFINNFYNKIFL